MPQSLVITSRWPSPKESKASRGKVHADIHNLLLHTRLNAIHWCAIGKLNSEQFGSALHLRNYLYLKLFEL